MPTQPKVYRTELRSTFLPKSATNVLGKSGSHDQGVVYATARSKNEAVELIRATGVSVSAAGVSLVDRGGLGTDGQALVAATLFNETGEVFATPFQGRTVARFEGVHGWVLIGEITNAGEFISGALLESLECAIDDLDTRLRRQLHVDDQTQLDLVLKAAQAHLDHLKRQSGRA